MSTYYMVLDLPVVSATLGPVWASNLNDALTVVDAHDHTSGKGKQVPTAGILINADLVFNNYAASDLELTGYRSVGAALGAGVTSSVYVVNGDLYYNNGSGQNIKITNGSTLNAAAIGGIGGDYGSMGVPASLDYEQGSDTYHFYEDPAAVPADYSDIKVSGVTIVNDGYVGTQYYAKLINPTNQTENYTITLPTEISSGSGYKLVEMNTSGQMRATSVFPARETRNRAYYSYANSVNTNINMLANTTYTHTFNIVMPAVGHNLVTGYKYTLSHGGLFYYALTRLGAVGPLVCSVSLNIVIKEDSTTLVSQTYTLDNDHPLDSSGNATYKNYIGNVANIDFTMSDATLDLGIYYTLTFNLSSGAAQYAVIRRFDFYPVIT
jgi:hypothetical protein